MDNLVSQLRAIAEPTRLRLLALCAEAELTVSELTRILGQSQPRVSRHLKLLCDAGLLQRRPEGSWAFYRLAEETEAAGRLTREVAALLPGDDPQLTLDRGRLDGLKRERAARADAYFRANAAVWDRIRSLHVDEAEVERALLETLPDPVPALLDIGTGTGRMLQVFGERIEHGIGIDSSRDMLAVARARIEASALRHCEVRQADMYSLPLADASFDAVMIHQVLHYADRPGRAIAEAARVLRPGGRLVIADFAPHALEALRDEAAHRRLGFADDEVAEWCGQAGLAPRPARHLPGGPLTVVIWHADRPPADDVVSVARGRAAAVEEAYS